ncbi:pyridoxal phosphate-dependent decarboxylase family protein [Streptomyces albogriseolus]|uniref:pyridoxal phosphate-dependent decarboxylase family protein n=1 Tax=Streptomyces albogriseolus TaxID=1887 RepID=UPI00368BECCF
MTTEFSPKKFELQPHVAPELDLANARGTPSLAAWFLGPMAENRQVLTELINDALDKHCGDRKNFYPDDPEYVSDEIKRSQAYQDSVEALRLEHTKLLERLEGSVPFFSYRYQAHMLWDHTLPSIAGYFAAMLYNQNNVAAEASPVTTRLEEEVGLDLCRLLGYDEARTPTPWGHLTCDGTVANLEALWSARNLMYYPLAVAEAIRRHEHDLGSARDITVRLANSRDNPRLLDLDAWESVNLPVDEVLSLSNRLVEDYHVKPAHLGLINEFTLQYLGYEAFRRRFLDGQVGDPAVLVTATMHYSWLKAAAILGIGQGSLIPIDVDLDARAAEGCLRTKLESCVRDRRPVVCHVAVLGSTEQSAIDPLERMLEVREEFRRHNVSYPIHVDAAWGGYFAAMKRIPSPPGDGQLPGPTPDLVMSGYANRQYDCLNRADSITIDPHKAGFVPYPAGGLCYRNGTQKNLVSFAAPYIDQGSSTAGVGLYGVEGSKPGAAAASVYLSHRVITADQNGYGKILGQALFNSKRLYAAVVTMGLDYPGFLVVPCQRLPAERNSPGNEQALGDQLCFIKERIVDRSNDELRDDSEAMRLLAELGSDQLIIAYAFNSRADGKPNPNLDTANLINRRIARKLAIPPEIAVAEGMPETEQRPAMIVSGSKLDPNLYGREYVHRMLKQLGVVGDPTKDSVDCLISCTMDPWMTDTVTGNFIVSLREFLATAVHEAIHHVAREGF